MEAAPQWDQQSPQGDMVGHFGMADRAEVDGIVKPQALEPILRHHQAHIDVALAAPVELVPLATKAIGSRSRFHCGDSLRHHLAPDTVAGNHRDPIIFRHAAPSAERQSLSRRTARRNPLAPGRIRFYAERERSGWEWSSGP